MTLIKHPFKKKRSTIAGDGKRSPSTTPRSTRASTARSNSLGSSVNSYEESGFVVEPNLNASSKNIYADIDNDDSDDCGFATNKPAVFDLKPPDLPADNPKFEILQISTINECETFEECVEDDFVELKSEINCSKNNLLLIDDELMTNSIDNHLNNIELINKNLDKLMQAQLEIERDDKCEAPPEIEAAKKKLKQKIAEKIKMLKEARMMSPSSSGESAAKESFKSRVKNIFPKFDRQPSDDDGASSDEKVSISKKILASFKKKQPSVDESEEVFEEIKKVSSDNSHQVTDLDENLKAGEEKDEKLSSKLKSKLKLNMKSAKMLMRSKKPPTIETCQRCSKKFRESKEFRNKALLDFNNVDPMLDNDFCVCVDVFDDGVFIKNVEYKDVSVTIASICFIFWHGIRELHRVNGSRCRATVR